MSRGSEIEQQYEAKAAIAYASRLQCLNLETQELIALGQVAKMIERRPVSHDNDLGEFVRRIIRHIRNHYRQINK